MRLSRKMYYRTGRLLTVPTAVPTADGSTRAERKHTHRTGRLVNYRDALLTYLREPHGLWYAPIVHRCSLSLLTVARDLTEVFRTCHWQGPECFWLKEEEVRGGAPREKKKEKKNKNIRERQEFHLRCRRDEKLRSHRTSRNTVVRNIEYSHK